MPTNDYLAFGTAGGANVLTQAAWAALAARSSGFAAGTAASAQLNKAWRQASMMSAALGALINSAGGVDALDDGVPANLQTGLQTAITNLASANAATRITDTGTANAMALTLSPVPANLAALAGRLFIITKSANANTAAVTINPNAIGATAVVAADGSALTSGQWPASAMGLVLCTGTGWVLLDNPAPNRYALLAGNSGQQFSIANGSSAAHAVAFGQFASSQAASGYQKLPSGLIVQWGTNLITLSGTVTFPIAFPTACFAVVTSEGAAGGATWGTGAPTLHAAGTKSTTGYTGWSLGWTGSGWTGASPLTQAYVAIGN